MTTAGKTPFVIILAQMIIGIVALFYVLYIGQSIILPLIYAIVISILLNPVVNWLHRKGINRVVAIFLSIFAALAAVGGLLYFIGHQATMFSDTFPQLSKKFDQFFTSASQWVGETFNIKQQQIHAWVEKTKAKTMDNSGQLFSSTLITIGGLLTVLFLMPVYMFMILYYKPLLLEFVSRLFHREKHELVAEVLLETKSLIQSYLTGLMIEACIVATLNSIGLLIIGVDYAILLGIIGALLNIIPYIGGIIAVAMPMIIALATQSSTAALMVMGWYIIVQFADNNFIVPKIVGSKVKLNALASIVVVLIGGALWGIPGMFLSIPLTAIVKVIFDRIEPLTPFGFLLGDTMPPLDKTIFKFRKPRRRKTVAKVEMKN